MKKIIYIFSLLITSCTFLASCDQNQDLLNFNTEESYLYFDLPHKLDKFGRETSEVVDSLVYSFALDLDDVTSYTFKIPLAVSGISAEEDRTYTVEIVSEETTATSEDWDEASLSKTVIHKGNVLDTLLVKVNRTEILKTDWRTIVFKIKPNGNFLEGREDRLTAKISFTDILQPPVWWKDWEKVFGPFYKETYLKWQEIYYYGADPNKAPWYVKVSKDSDDFLYWDNMAVGYYAGSSTSLPSTFMFIAKLRDYFNENEVYGTNPDGTKTRIKIN